MPLGSIDPGVGRLKTRKILERLHFIIGGYVDEGARNSDRIVELN